MTWRIYVLTLFIGICEVYCRDRIYGDSDPKCKSLGQFLPDKSSSCHYLVCTNGHEPWKDRYGNTRLFSMSRECPPGTAVPHKYHGGYHNPCTAFDGKCRPRSKKLTSHEYSSYGRYGKYSKGRVHKDEKYSVSKYDKKSARSVSYPSPDYGSSGYGSYEPTGDWFGSRKSDYGSLNGYNGYYSPVVKYGSSRKRSPVKSGYGYGLSGTKLKGREGRGYSYGFGKYADVYDSVFGMSGYSDDSKYSDRSSHDHRRKASRYGGYKSSNKSSRKSKKIGYEDSHMEYDDLGSTTRYVSGTPDYDLGYTRSDNGLNRYSSRNKYDPKSPTIIVKIEGPPKSSEYETNSAYFDY